MNVAMSIDSFAESYTLKRQAAGTSTGGRFTPSSTVTTSTIRAVVVPASGADLQKLASGLATGDVQAVYTRTALYANGLDKVVIGGADYQIEHVDDYDTQGAYVKALARRVQ